jgi:hypothetical protein
VVALPGVLAQKIEATDYVAAEELSKLINKEN